MNIIINKRLEWFTKIIIINCLDHIFPLVVDKPVSDIRAPMYNLLYHTLLNNWQYFFKSTLGSLLYYTTQIVLDWLIDCPCISFQFSLSFFFLFLFSPKYIQPCRFFIVFFCILKRVWDSLLNYNTPIVLDWLIVHISLFFFNCYTLSLFHCYFLHIENKKCWKKFSHSKFASFVQQFIQKSSTTLNLGPCNQVFHRLYLFFFKC